MGRKNKLPQGRLLHKVCKPANTYLVQTIGIYFLRRWSTNSTSTCGFTHLSGSYFIASLALDSFFLPMSRSAKPCEKQHRGIGNLLHPFVQVQYRSVTGLLQRITYKHPIYTWVKWNNWGEALVQVYNMFSQSGFEPTTLIFGWSWTIEVRHFVRGYNICSWSGLEPTTNHTIDDL